ncbi:hypothetical protein [Plastoroseomonas arctica]|uniref:Uncharacterized protein n=1 Tax=Plastoroseomonas arctica TaxID=1509237 RepID=A0AAF1JWD6_9PROT|nr:hypothetical protein [Plastoroseomonas arctica]MBR0655255.1 hypothetical protein [Plastoroseomonas arctica]
MTDAEMEALAKARGLGVAWRDHKADVVEAIDSAARLARGFTRVAATAAEPIPPYAVARR